MPQRALLSLVRAYRYFLSPWLGSACRFEPTCSAYSLQAIETHGAGAGAYMTLHRLARCHPWCEGGHDPVPALPPALFRSFTSAAHVPAAATPFPSTDNKTSP
ncbi:MAG: membrane protein insertion efficiency factor YidD [Burkholderiaceae bacterium]